MKTAPPKSLPKLRRNATGVPPAPRYREQYGVIIICPDEATQVRLFEGLAALRECAIRVVTT